MTFIPLFYHTNTCVQSLLKLDVQQSPKTAVSLCDATIRGNVRHHAYDRPAALTTGTAAGGFKAADTGAMLMTDIRRIASDAQHEHLIQSCQLHM